MDDNNNLSGEYKEPERPSDNSGQEYEHVSGEYRDPGHFSGSDDNFAGNYSGGYDGGNPNQYSAPRGNTGNGLGIASLILGIISLVGLCFCLGPITGILAVIFGIIYLSRGPEKRAFGIAGIITGAMGVILSVIVFFIILFGIASFEGAGSTPFFEMYEQILEEQEINPGKEI